ncbi:hypothetical protein [Modestobacter sp. SSW1-42]|uniref:hypothetical protein n=1 Tax=Modestobacter sp. SSW1-42 TaxID=596372 RepID=UPI003987D635
MLNPVLSGWADPSWWLRLYEVEVVERGKQPLLLLLLGVVGGFLAIRVSTRLIRARVRWWPGNISVSGVHLHHVVVGVAVMTAAGVASFALPTTGGWRSGLALGFGLGTGLVLDEFALLLHLRDVYWSRQGRSSVDAVVVVATLTAMVLLGVLPFDLGEAGDAQTGGGSGGRWAASALIAVNAALSVVTAVKGKLWTALLSVPLWPVGMVGAVRLARPDSPWARRRYPAGSARDVRARRRARRWEQTRDLLLTTVAGRMDDDDRPAETRDEPEPHGVR